jgi:osmotically-inducible protein OsmY
MNQSRRVSTFLSAAVLLLLLAGCSSTSEKGGGGSSYFDDAAITARVKKAIYNEPSLKVGDIGVKTQDKVVQLSGAVGSRVEIRRAAEVAGKVEGVKRVKNDLQVKQ